LKRETRSKSENASAKLKETINDAIKSMDKITRHEMLEEKEKNSINSALKAMKDIKEKLHSQNQDPDFDDLQESTDDVIVILKKLQKSVPEYIFKKDTVVIEGYNAAGSKESKPSTITPLRDIISQMEGYSVIFEFKEAEKTLEFFYKKLGIDKKIKDLNRLLEETYKTIRTNDMVEDINEIIAKQGEGEIKGKIIINFIKEFKYTRAQFRDFAKNADKLNIGLWEDSIIFVRSLFSKEKREKLKKESVAKKFEREIKNKILKNLEGLINKLNENLEKTIEEKIEEELNHIEENINDSLVRKDHNNLEIKAYEEMVDRYHHDAKKAIELLNEIEMEVTDLSSNPTTAIG